MARTQAQPQAPEKPDDMVSDFPEDFEFSVVENVAIPETPARYRPPSHPWVALFDKMGHNSSFFVPLSYWISKRGRTAEATPFSWQRQTIGTTFADWKKKGAKDPKKPTEDNPRSKWRLVTVARQVGDDAEFAKMAGVRCWMVDTTRG